MTPYRFDADIGENNQANHDRENLQEYMQYHSVVK